MQQVDVRFLEVGFRLQFRVPPMTVDSSAFVDKGSIVKRTVLQSLIQSMQQNYVVEVVRDRVLLSPLPCPEEVRKMETSHRPLISQFLPLIRSFLLSKGDMLIHGRSSSVSLRPQRKWFLWDGCTL